MGKVLPFVTNIIVLYGRMWPCMAVCGLLWSCLCRLVVLYGLFNFHGLVWHFYGRLWQNVDFIGLVSSFLAVIDPNSFGLVIFVDSRLCTS